MANIALTAALRSNLLSLQGTQSLLDQTQLRLATGKKVNSALDNPSSFFAAQALTNRAGDLSNLLDGIGQSIQVLKAADQGITSLTTLVKQAQSIAQSAQNQLSSSALLRSADISVAKVANVGVIATTLNLTTNGVTSNITVSGQSLATIAASINAVSGLSAQVVDATSAGITIGAGAKRLEIRATGGNSLTVAANAAGTYFTTDQNAGVSTSVAGNVGGVLGAAYAPAAVILASSNAADQISLENQYSSVRTQIDSLITDAGYQGTNLLNGDTLKVQFNEKNTSSLSVSGVTFNSTGLGISFSATGSTASFLNAANITTALNQITASLSSLRAQAQTFGNNLNIVQTRQDFTSNLINTLKAGSDQLTLADKNEEGANLLALQTSQQLGIQALSLASQANQSVLRLFQ